MKKSLLNISLTVALSSTALSSAIWSTQAYSAQTGSSEAGETETFNIFDHNNNAEPTENYMYHGMGAGAATGALLAGPVGLVVGGLVGAFAGSSQAVTEIDPSEDTSIYSSGHAIETDQEILTTANGNSTDSHSELASLQVARLGAISDLPQSDIDTQNNNILDILTDELSLDVYFRSGSSNIEAFYPARLTAIAKLMESMTSLEIHLDGYADRRGDKDRNKALADQRINAVRQQLINAGVDENRIISKAFGEMKMVSRAGDLEGYTFDRKVVIRFERSTADSISTMTSTLSALPPEYTASEMAVIDSTPEETIDDSAADSIADVNIRF
jgi:sortase system peptidoglycan-associated protein